jgi:dimethylsulfone monooxygenase
MGDGRRPKSANPLLSSKNRLKLGVFGINCSGGTTMSNQPGAIKAEWKESVAITHAAENAGIEAMVPIGRWKGMGGATNFQYRSFESLTWAAGIAAVTEKIAIFATVHVPTIHPVRLAKTCATIDHISDGRFVLNVVAGWNEKEMGMFAPAQLPHDERYAVATEWLQLTKALWEKEEDIDWDGKYYKVPDASSYPKPVQSPGPLLMSAGNSKSGIAFAAAHCDVNFVAAPSIEIAGSTAIEVKEYSRAKYGRELSVFSQAYIICRETEAEAREVYRRLTHEDGDHVGARNLLDLFVPNSSSADWEKMKPAIIAGWGSYPIVGTPKQVADGLIAFSEAGLDGMIVSWPDYMEGISQFDTQIMPYLEKAGVRSR